MTIRKTRMDDLARVQEIYAGAREYMAKSGNPTQWGTHKPPVDQVLSDINTGKSYVCEKDGEIIAVFYFAVEEDETYQVIYDGAWLNDGPYGVLHRVAVSSQEKGIGSFCAKWAFERCKNLRIDTHENNIAMRKMLEKNGFTYCGKITIQDGTERIAFQKIS